MCVCVLRWTDLTTCDVSTSPEAFICQICVRKINCFLDDGLDVRVRCGEWKRQLYVKNAKLKLKLQSLMGNGPKIGMSCVREV